MRRIRRPILWTLVGGFACQAASCGALIHPERVGRPHGNRLDAGVVVLDGLGLLCFFVPGVIAFVVDFGTGAIWLPPGSQAAAKSPGEWQVVHVPATEMTDERIEAVVGRHVGQSVDLSDAAVRIERVRSIDDVPPTVPPFVRPSQP